MYNIHIANIYHGGAIMNRAYVRVSTVEQNEDRQIEGLKPHDIDKWYIEKVSGKNMDREQLMLMLSEAEKGDTIFVHDFSRMARSTVDLLNIVNDLRNRGINLVSNKEGFDTSTATGELMLTVIAALNQFERRNMLERQSEGIRLAKQRGAYKNCGRKENEYDPFELKVTMELLEMGDITKVEAAKRLNVSRPTLYKLIARYAA